MNTHRRISASSFHQLLHCPHALFLDHHGDPALKTPLGEFEDYLLDEGRRFETEVLQGQSYVQPDYPEGDLDAGFKATLQLIAAGHALIYQGVLMTDGYIGIPDLLVRREGPSLLGGWHYEPHEIKTARSVKDAHVLQLCLYALMLEQLQGRRPRTGTITLSDETEVIIDLEAIWPEFETRLAEAKAIITRQRQTDLAIFSGCEECPWRDACHTEAVRRKDVTLVAGLRRRLKPQLLQAGITTLLDLAASDPDLLLDMDGVGEKTAERLVMRSR